MNLKTEMQEINHKQEVIKYFKLFGVADCISHIIGKDLVTFEFKTHKEFLKVFKLLSP